MIFIFLVCTLILAYLILAGACKAGKTDEEEIALWIKEHEKKERKKGDEK